MLIAGFPAIGITVIAEHHPDDIDVWVFLAQARRKLGNNKAANKAYRKVLELVPVHFEAGQNREQWHRTHLYMHTCLTLTYVTI